MHIIYFDESGDDGWPGSSELFILTSLAINVEDYKNTFESIKEFRRDINGQLKFPTNIEFHTRELLLNKKPYTKLAFDETKRLNILFHFVSKLSTLPVKITNVVIDKLKIENCAYDILDCAVKYSIQRTQNTFDHTNPGEKFIIISDEGRVEKMRKTSRAIQKFNIIPNDGGLGTYRKEIHGLVEDPLPKSSDQSFFIQFCDLAAYLVNLYMKVSYHNSKLPSNLPKSVDLALLQDYFDILKPILNLAASRYVRPGYGIVCYPR